MQRRTLRRHLAGLTTLAMSAAALALAPGLASAATQAPAGHTLAPNTRFYVPPPAQGSVQQILQLVKSGQLKNAGLITAMESVPSAVWLDGETAAQAAEPGNEGSEQADADVAQQVRLTLAAARLENAVPIFVAYNIPGRDCSEYSAGGRRLTPPTMPGSTPSATPWATPRPWCSRSPTRWRTFPGYCGAAYATEFPDITNTTRVDDVRYAVSTLEADPNISLYLDAGNSAWQNVGGMAETLTAADVQQSQGFFLNVSNYQYDANSDYYGTWVSACIAYATVNEAQTPADALADVAAFSGLHADGAFARGRPSPAAARTSTGTAAHPEPTSPRWLGPYTGVALSPYGVWSETSTTADLNTSGIDASYASALGGTVPTTHFIVDTSRNGLGPDSMQTYAAAPYDQPSQRHQQPGERRLVQPAERRPRNQADR